MSAENNSKTIMVRVTPSIMDLVTGIARKKGLKPATLARMGLLQLVEQLRAPAHEIEPEIAVAIAAMKKRGVDVKKLITDAEKNAA